jgi:hypothetical protein
MHVEVDSSGLPRFAFFFKASGDETQKGMDFWEDTDGTCSAFESLIDAPNSFGRARFDPV